MSKSVRFVVSVSAVNWVRFTVWSSLYS